MIEKIYNIVWSDALVWLCLLTGVYFSIRLGFPQLTRIGKMVKLIFKGTSSQEGISSFQAFSLAISGRVGTGNIAGVATAIAMGGPGAVFWMWVIAILGSASALVEATLGQMYKEIKDGQYRGGPAFYILKGLKSKAFAWIFALVTIVSTGFLLPSVQSNSIMLSAVSALPIDPLHVGVGLCLLLAAIIFGGVRRISKVAEFVVPFMAGAYILMALVIIGLNISKLPAVFELIISSALNREASFGGIIGMAISWGVKRGIYSNEAGQGTAPHAAAAAEVSHPIDQGLVQGFSVYVDTLFVCTATALMILFSGQYNVVNPEGGFLTENLPGVQIGPEYTQAAVAQHFPTLGASFVALALFFFAFTTIMAYYYIAETNVSFIVGSKNPTLLIWLLRLLLLGSVLLGCMATPEDAWKLGDIGVGLMAWLNLIAILLLHGKVLKIYRSYRLQEKAGIPPTYQDPNTTAWAASKKATTT